MTHHNVLVGKVQASMKDKSYNVQVFAVFSGTVCRVFDLAQSLGGFLKVY